MGDSGCHRGPWVTLNGWVGKKQDGSDISYNVPFIMYVYQTVHTETPWTFGLPSPCGVQAGVHGTTYQQGRTHDIF